jgi:5-amino-6-(5-phosphoribosylamino)uracil reductase
MASSLLHAHHDEIRKRLDTAGWIIGHHAMGADGAGTSHEDVGTTAPRAPHVIDPKGSALAISIDLQGRLPPSAHRADNHHVVAVVGSHLPDAYLAELRDGGISYVFAEADDDGLSAVLEAIGETFNVDRLCLKGADGINGAFLKAGLIDEISLIVKPGMDGDQGMPMIYDHLGSFGDWPASDWSLRHILTERQETGLVWRRYLVERAPAP